MGRSKWHIALNFIISIPIALVLLIEIWNRFYVFVHGPMDSGSLAGYGIFMGGITLIVFPILVILSFFTLYLELKYIKRNNLSKKELFKAPSFYVVAYIIFMIITTGIHTFLLFHNG